MNQRIKELARQADAYAWQQIDEGADYDEQPQFFAEKFAELIVRECAVAMNEMPRYAKTKPFQEMENATIEDCIRTVKEHFGVEE